MNDTIPQKRCTKCREEKPATNEYYNVDKKRKDGLYPQCKVCRQKIRVDKRALNPEKIAEYHRNYFQQNRAYLVEYHQNYNKENATYLSEHKRKYRQENKHLSRNSSHRRRARERCLPQEFTVKDWQNCLEYWHGCCAVCGRQFNNLFGTHTAAADHWIPVNHPDCPGTIPANIVPLCHGRGGCNNRKQNRNAEQWLKEMFGKTKAASILKRIQAYFDSL